MWICVTNCFLAENLNVSIDGVCESWFYYCNSPQGQCVGILYLVTNIKKNIWSGEVVLAFIMGDVEDIASKEITAGLYILKMFSVRNSFYVLATVLINSRLNYLNFIYSVSQYFQDFF